MNLRAVAVYAGSAVTGLTACLMGAVIAASPAEAPTLDEACQPTCPVVTQTPIDRPAVNPDRIGPRQTLKP